MASKGGRCGSRHEGSHWRLPHRKNCPWPPAATAPPARQAIRMEVQAVHALHLEADMPSARRYALRSGEWARRAGIWSGIRVVVVSTRGNVR
jgi:hypothetical protein